MGFFSCGAEDVRFRSGRGGRVWAGWMMEWAGEVGMALEVVDIVEWVMKDQLPKSILHIGTYSNIYDSYHNYLFRPKGKG